MWCVNVNVWAIKISRLVWKYCECCLNKLYCCFYCNFHSFWSNEDHDDAIAGIPYIPASLQRLLCRYDMHPVRGLVLGLHHLQQVLALYRELIFATSIQGSNNAIKGTSNRKLMHSISFVFDFCNSERLTSEISYSLLNCFHSVRTRYNRVLFRAVL